VTCSDAKIGTHTLASNRQENNTILLLDIGSDQVFDESDVVPASFAARADTSNQALPRDRPLEQSIIEKRGAHQAGPQKKGRPPLVR